MQSDLSLSIDEWRVWWRGLIGFMGLFIVACAFSFGSAVSIASSSCGEPRPECIATSNGITIHGIDPYIERETVSDPHAIPPNWAAACLPNAQFQIEGIPYPLTSEQLRNRPCPTGKHCGTDEYSGIPYGIDLDIPFETESDVPADNTKSASPVSLQQTKHIMLTKSPGFRGPGGVQVGMSWDEVVRRIKPKLDNLYSNFMVFVNCNSKRYTTELRLEFNESRQLTRILMQPFRYCLPVSALAIGDLRVFSAKRDDIVNRLGQPSRSNTNSENVTNYEGLSYKGFWVNLYHNTFFNVLITSDAKNLVLPGGLKAGLTKGAALRTLGIRRFKTMAKKSVYFIPGCADDVSGLEMEFDEHGLLKTIFLGYRNTED